MFATVPCRNRSSVANLLVPLGIFILYTLLMYFGRRLAIASDALAAVAPWYRNNDFMKQRTTPTRE